MKKIYWLSFAIAALVGIAVGWMFVNRQPLAQVIDSDIPTQDDMRGAFRYLSQRPVQFSPDGRYVAALVYRGSNKNTIGGHVLVPDQLYFWDVQERKRLKVIRLNNDAENAYFPPMYQVRSDGTLLTIRNSPHQADSVSLFSYDPRTDTEKEIQKHPAKASFLFSADGATLIRVNYKDNRDKLELFDTMTGESKGFIQLPKIDTIYSCLSIPGHNKIAATNLPRQNAEGSKRSFLVDIESKSIITQFDLPIDVIFWELSLQGSKLCVHDSKHDYFIDVVTGQCQTYDYAKHFPPRLYAIVRGYYATWLPNLERAVVTCIYDRNSSTKGQDFHLIDAENNLIKTYEIALTGRAEIHRWIPGTSQMIVKRVLQEPPTFLEYWYRRVAGWLQPQAQRMNYQDVAVVDVEKGTISPWYSWDHLLDVDIAPFPDGKHFLMLSWKRMNFELSILDPPGTIHWAGRGVLPGLLTMVITWMLLQLVLYPKIIFGFLIRPFRLRTARH